MMVSLFAICTTLEDTVADPDLQIRVCGGEGAEGVVIHKRGAWSPKKICLVLKIRGWAGLPGPSHGSATEMHKVYDELSVPKTWN